MLVYLHCDGVVNFWFGRSGFERGTELRLVQDLSVIDDDVAFNYVGEFFISLAKIIFMEK